MLGGCGKVGVSINAKCHKVQWKQINHDIHEAQLKRPLTKSRARQNHQMCGEMRRL